MARILPAPGNQLNPENGIPPERNPQRVRTDGPWYEHAVHRRFDVAALRIVGFAWKLAAGLGWLGSSGEDSNAVPARLAQPNGAVAGLPYRAVRELLLLRLQLLQADHVRCGLREPSLENGEAP